jgi:hypothetical protein
VDPKRKLDPLGDETLVTVQHSSAFCSWLAFLIAQPDDAGWWRLASFTFSANWK